MHGIRVGASHWLARSSSVPSINLGVLGGETTLCALCGKSVQGDGTPHYLPPNYFAAPAQPRNLRDRLTKSNNATKARNTCRGEPLARPLFLCALDKPRCPRWQKVYKATESSLRTPNYFAAPAQPRNLRDRLTKSNNATEMWNPVRVVRKFIFTRNQLKFHRVNQRLAGCVKAKTANAAPIPLILAPPLR